MRILLGDDDDLFAVPFSRALAALGDVMHVRDGESARSALLAMSFNVVLCEVNLPALSGYRLLQEMRSILPDTARRLVFYTSDPHTRAARAVARLHIRPLLAKPITVEQVRHLVVHDP